MSDAKDKAASPPPAGKTLAKLHGGAPIQAIVPSDLGEAFAIAEMIFAAGLAPDSIKTPQALTAIFMKGMELRLPPMAAMECLGVINGKVCLYGDGIPALLWSHGFKIKDTYRQEGNDLNTCVAHCKITRPEGDEYEFEYSAQDAKDNQLWDTREKDSKGNPNKSPWFRYKRRMLRMRCRGWLARDCASDVLKGIPIYEEQADIELGRDEYHEVKPAVLPVPTDIDDGTAPVVSEAEASQAKPEADEPSAVLMAYENDLKGAKSEKALTVIDRRHKDALATLDADMGKVAEEMRAKALAQVKGGKPAKDEAQGALLE